MVRNDRLLAGIALYQLPEGRKIADLGATFANYAGWLFVN
jgi:hypothetical protein